ncbi:MAG TPA: hypothetical protein VNK23_08055 [Candidatus Dormibacteraeota bacterium]|nr:hypothetical protein [Candidatus Dormibacteraeota bacterium]
MKGNGLFCWWRAAARLILACAFFALPVAHVCAARERIHIQPKFQPGDTLYYQIEMHSVSTGKTTTPIINPEGGTKFSENVDLLVQLDVLPEPSAVTGSAKPEQAAGGEPVRMRVTYLKAHADSQSDAPAFDTSLAGSEYDRLAGHSFEFTLEPGGGIADFKDVDHILPNSSDPAQTLSWMKNLASGNEFPQRGIAIGQKWASEKPLASAPLTGLVWQADSTYLRNEPCSSPAATARAKRNSSAASGQCAVIMTEFQIVRHSSKHSETPPDYLRHGLRTSGAITGSGESLDSISLETGLLTSSTQSSTQNADFDITSAANGEAIHRVGQVQTQTNITQVSAPPAAATQP